ncbi:MAG TPA: class I SAM-dependent methyltransferase [Gemmatimonadaceae bacterium]|nr:class I SAM-dependent methyltransferase [Gemmatimonadaceae bacterium]
MSSAGFDFDAEYGANYDRIIRQVVPAYDHLFPMVLALLRDRVRRDARVLVTGVGSGSELVTFASAEPGWLLTGVDPSAQMLAITRAKLAQRGVASRVTLHQGVTQELPPAAPFDAATLICVLHFHPDDGAKLELLRAIAERLRPGAPLALIDGRGEPGTPEFEAMFAAWMRFIELMGMDDEGRATYRAQLEASVRWIPERRLRELLAEAGFGEVARFYEALAFGGWLAVRA